MAFYSDFRDLLRLLNDHGVRYVIVGGYAIAHHGWPRYTQDLDLLIEVSSDNAERVLASLEAFGFASPELTREKLLDERTLVQLGRPPTQVEILTSITGVAWEEIYAHRESGEYAGVPVSYIGRAQFIKNKLAAGRLKDLADLEAIGETPDFDQLRQRDQASNEETDADSGPSEKS